MQAWARLTTTRTAALPRCAWVWARSRQGSLLRHVARATLCVHVQRERAGHMQGWPALAARAGRVRPEQPAR